MSQAVDTWIVVPCFNEAQRLRPEAFLEAVTRQKSLGLVFVDDGSLDRTPNILRRLATRSDRIRWRSLPINRGKGEAVRLGMADAVLGDCGVASAAIAWTMSG